MVVIGLKMGAMTLDTFVRQLAFCAACLVCWSDAASINARFLEVPLGVSSHSEKPHHHISSSNLSSGPILVEDGSDSHEVPSWFVTGFVFVVVALFLVLLLIAACVCLRERKDDSTAARGQCQGQCGGQASRVHTLSESQPPPTYNELFGIEQDPPAYDSLYPHSELLSPQVQDEEATSSNAKRVDTKEGQLEAVVLHI